MHFGDEQTNETQKNKLSSKALNQNFRAIPNMRPRA